MPSSYHLTLSACLTSIYRHKFKQKTRNLQVLNYSFVTILYGIVIIRLKKKIIWKLISVVLFTQ